MNRDSRRFVILPLAMTVMLLGVAAVGWAGDEEAEFDVANIFFELNNTDGDLGIHALIDGDAWKTLEIESPDEREKLKISARGTMRRQGLTELFFESAEPTFDELDPADFFARFPEGEWEVEGVTIDGEELESTTFLRHVLAAPPANIRVSGQLVSEDCDEDPGPSVDASMPINVTWDAVTSSHPELGNPGAIEVALYQVVIEREEPEPLKITVDLPPSVTAFQLAPGLLNADEEIKIEVLVREATGNQTATESCFETE